MNRRYFIGGIGGVVSILSGCIGGDDDLTSENEETDTDADDGETDTNAEPDSLPSGLSEDGVVLDVLEEHIIAAVTDDSYTTDGFFGGFVDGDLDESIARVGRGNTQQERGIRIRSSDSEEMIEEDPRDADYVRLDYFDGEEGYRNGDRNDPSTWDRGFEYFTEFVLSSWKDQIFEIMSLTDWDAPEWDDEIGRYVVSAVEFDDDIEPELHEGELHVAPDGTPIHLAGRYDIDGKTVEGMITFSRGDTTVEELEWVTEAE